VPPFTIGRLHSVDAIQNYVQPGEGLLYELLPYGLTNNYGDGGYGRGDVLLYGTLTGAPTVNLQATLTAAEDLTYQGLPYTFGVYGNGAYEGTLVGGISGTARDAPQSTSSGGSA
jgi:hypothetical protein